MLRRYDLAIVGKALINSAILKCTILVSRGIISKIKFSTHNIKKQAERVITLNQNEIMLPGMIDIHVHLRDLMLAYKEDVYTGSCAAAAGGVTVVCDMPNTVPFINTYDKLLIKMNAFKKSVVDYGIYLGLPDNIEELEKAKEHIVGLKIYPKDYNKHFFAEEIIRVSKLNILTVFHAEIHNYIANIRSLFKNKIRNMLVHNIIRNKLVELNCIQYLYDILNKLNAGRFHFTHVSSAQAILFLKKWKRVQKNITVDTCPHYILLTNKLLRKIGGFAKVNPPLRSENDRRVLLEALIDGTIDAIVSDHAPHALNEKEREFYDEVPSGFPGLETTLPLLLTLVNKKILSLTTLVKVFSKNPAKILKIYDRFGSISEGKYCSIVIVDLKKSYKIDSSKFFSKAKFSPFEGYRVTGSIEQTIVRGTIVYSNGEIWLKEGHGRNIKELLKSE